MSLRIGSLCSGYGGLDMAVMDVLDAEVAWHAQYDPDDRHQYAAQILTHHWLNVPNHGDITAIDWSSVETVDILTAGFPCQPVSNAGKRKGNTDDRWLWPDVANAIRALRPRLVFLENVAALLVRGFGAVACDLAALGYDFAWTCLRASDIGAPHRRERWFCLAWDPDDDLRLRARGPVQPQESDPPGDASGPVDDPSGVGKREPADQAHPVAGGRDAREEPSGRSVRAAADSGRLQSERRGGLGVLGGQAPAEPSEEGQRERAGDTAVGRGPAPADADDASARPKLNREPYRPEGHDEHAGIDAAGRVLDWGDYGPAIAQWERVMVRPAPAPTDPARNGPRLAPRFVEWMMGAPEGHITSVPGIPRNAQLKAAGNGVVPQQGSAALHMLIERRWLTQTTHAK